MNFTPPPPLLLIVPLRIIIIVITIIERRLARRSVTRTTSRRRCWLIDAACSAPSGISVRSAIPQGPRATIARLPKPLPRAL